MTPAPLTKGKELQRADGIWSRDGQNSGKDGGACTTRSSLNEAQNLSSSKTDGTNYRTKAAAQRIRDERDHS